MKINHKMGPVVLDRAQTESIYSALVSAGHTELAALVLSKSSLTGEEEKFATIARMELDGELEVDDEPVVSISEEGAFVMAWYWVDTSDVTMELSHS
jgi:hypothetical protein